MDEFGDRSFDYSIIQFNIFSFRSSFFFLVHVQCSEARGRDLYEPYTDSVADPVIPRLSVIIMSAMKFHGCLDCRHDMGAIIDVGTQTLSGHKYWIIRKQY